MSGIFESLADAIPDNLRKDVERELINGFRMSAVKATAEAKQNAAYNHANEASNIEGIGRLRMRIPADAYHYWGMRLGYGCWEDTQFLKEFERDNPEVAVRNYAKKTVVGGAVFTADGFIAQ